LARLDLLDQLDQRAQRASAQLVSKVILVRKERLVLVRAAPLESLVILAQQVYLAQQGQPVQLVLAQLAYRAILVLEDLQAQLAQQVYKVLPVSPDLPV
jgi:hypothetical protein